MLVSERFQLNRTQATLDFVDVDIDDDLRVFVDPRAIKLLKSDWGYTAVAMIQHFFSSVLEAISSQQDDVAAELLSELREPKETRLGLSEKGHRGRGMSDGLAADVRDALLKSKAVETGLLRDLEDTILMVEGIGFDIVSDIATNILRKQLIEYTQRMCSFHGIPMEAQVSSGSLWDLESKEWYNEFVSLPVIDGKKLLLVPKIIVRRVLEYDVGEYHRDYVLEHLRQIELADPQSNLVKLLKSRDERIVTNKKLIEKYGRGKKMILDVTVKHPEILDQYRKDKSAAPAAPITNEQLEAQSGAVATNWEALYSEVHRVQAGKDEAGTYERAVEILLTGLFYPSLTNPDVQFRIHDGRKRVDIVYTNCAVSGFFQWAGQHYSCPLIHVECKNYSGEVGNPELDQLSGRFSDNRGRVGLLVVRRFDDKQLFIRRCKDTANDGRGFVVPLDDGDLHELVERKKSGQGGELTLLRERFMQLIN